jgi:hypothetical protein
MMDAPRLAVLILAVAAAACAPSPTPRAATNAAARPDDLALAGLKQKLRELGYRIDTGARPPRGEAVVAARDGAAWYLSLGVESSSTAQGPKVLVRLSVFREPGRKLEGEIAPYTISVGGASAGPEHDALVRRLGARAAGQFAEHFQPGSP